ncbi:unnamed protein product [Prorocentrum cordatum]|uniref:Apple domain-containing protein n=1 Tax=Prorocentrum cordatum TaxID=2364126 RepID=A0ABN9RK68_9DINO|nr:unnamed protein product [Polarella glacialis]
MARASLLVAFSLLALAAGADESCSSGAEEAALLQTGNSQGRSITAHGARAGSSCAPPLPGKNNGGSNMGSSPGSGYGGDASSCEQLCGSTGGCQGWTFMQSTQTSTKQLLAQGCEPVLPCPGQHRPVQHVHLRLLPRRVPVSTESSCAMGMRKAVSRQPWDSCAQFVFSLPLAVCFKSYHSSLWLRSFF